MERELKSEPMAEDTMATGRMTVQMARAGSSMPTEMYTKDNESMINQAGSESFNMLTGRSTRDTGKTTNSMDKGAKLGQTEPCTKGVMRRA